MDLKARKVEIRREVVAKILAMEPEGRRRQEAALTTRFEAVSGFDAARNVLLYASAFPEEIDTRAMLRRSLELGKRLIMPSVNRTLRRLHLFEVADLDHELVPGHRNIPEPRPGCPEVEPTAVDWVLVPGLAFDGRGHRLGRGAGYYDKLLPTLRPEVPRWALILDVQWVEDLPIEPHDQPLDGVVDFQRVIWGNRLPGEVLGPDNNA
jgi:5-formyltetrahydrofolate cyclo-ligase